jgi:hypothetical protein
MKIYKTYEGLQLVGFRANSYIRLRQGHSTNPIKALSPTTDPMDEYFEVFGAEPEVLWGTGVYRVRPDNTLQLIKEDYDTSD